MDELAGELHNIDLDLAGSQATVDECKKPAGHLGLKCSAVFGFELRGDGAVEVKNTRRIVHIAGRGELGDSLAQSIRRAERRESRSAVSLWSPG